MRRFCAAAPRLGTIIFLRRRRYIPLALACACARTSAPPPAPVPAALPVVVAVPPPADATRDYTLWLGGAQIGTAREVERWSAGGVALVRTEAVRFFRGDAFVSLATTIEIDADRMLVPSRVAWTERGAHVRHAEATRRADGWRVAADGDAAEVRLPAAAIPAELAPLIVRRDGAFRGALFLPARDFVVGDARIEPIARHRLVAHFGDAARAEATIDLGEDEMPARVVDGDGVIAIRATAATAAAPFQPVDLVDATAIPIAGTRARRAVLALDGDLALPAVPGQSAQPTASGLAVALSPALPGALPPGPAGADRRREIASLVSEVRRRIAPDLGAGPTTARAATAATAGDCTTFALAYAALAARRSIPTRLVTGLRVDGARLVRHRWAVSWTGRAWIAVDAAYGAAPAGGDLVGLALHGADDAGLVAGETALAQVTSARWE